jgi:WD40 repeat protein
MLDSKIIVHLWRFSILIILFLSIQPVYALEPIWTYSSPGTTIGGVTVSADGSAIAVGAEKVLLFSKNGELLAKEPYGKAVLFTPDGGYLLTSYGPTLYFFERNATNSALQKKWDYELPCIVESIDLSDDGNIIVAAAGAGGTYIFSRSGKMTGSNDIYSAVIRVSPNGQTIAGVSISGLHRYSTSGKETLYKNISIISQPDVMEMTGSGATLIYNDAQRLVSVNAYGDGAELWNSLLTADITSLAMTPTGTRVLVGTQNGNVSLFNDKGNISWRYATNPAGSSGTMVREVALSTDGKIVAAGTYDGKIVTLDSSGRNLWSNITKDHINHIAMSADGSLVIATGDETVYAFSPSAELRSTVRSPSPSATSVQQKNTTSILTTTTTQKPIITDSITHTITSEPTPYSVIRTATQSPVSEIIPFLGILVALILLERR